MGRNALLGPPEAFNHECASAEIRAHRPPHLGPGRTGPLIADDPGAVVSVLRRMVQTADLGRVLCGAAGRGARPAALEEHRSARCGSK